MFQSHHPQAHRTLTAPPEPPPADRSSGRKRQGGGRDFRRTLSSPTNQGCWQFHAGACNLTPQYGSLSAVSRRWKIPNRPQSGECVCACFVSVPLCALVYIRLCECQRECVCVCVCSGLPWKRQYAEVNPWQVNPALRPSIKLSDQAINNADPGLSGPITGQKHRDRPRRDNGTEVI